MSASPSPASPSPAVPPPAGAAPLPQTPAQRRRQRLKLLAILLVCAAPVIASYLAYYVMPPLGRTNFGDLIEPQRPIPDLRLSGADGAAVKFGGDEDERVWEVDRVEGGRAEVGLVTYKCPQCVRCEGAPLDWEWGHVG